MRMILRVTRELYGLFVDDGLLALSVVGWLTIVWFVLPEIGVAGIVRCLVLFIGLGLILTENSVRKARRPVSNAYIPPKHAAETLPTSR